MKVIFLDIDGTLNNDSTKDRFEGMIFLEDQKLRLLKELINETGAQVVLSSTWRRGWYCKDNGLMQDSFDLADIRLFEALQAKLAEHGIGLLGYTDDFGLRGEEIDAWLKQWKGEPIEAYVILDDMDGREMHPHEDHLVQTAFWDGLLPEHVQKAAAILNACSSDIENESTDEDEELRYYRVNRIKCKRCGGLLECVHPTKEIKRHAMLSCSCGAVQLDPHVLAPRVFGVLDDIEDLSEVWHDDTILL